MRRSLAVLLTALALSGIAARASAQEILCTVVGARQGTFQDESSATRSSQIPVLFLTGEITVPRDAVSGLAAGRPVHQPLAIVKELDSASIQFFQAVTTNEILRSVTCTFYRSYRSGTALGAMRPYFKIALTNAEIVDYKDAGDGINGTAIGDERERISMTYQSMEITDLETNIMTLDDWSGG